MSEIAVFYTITSRGLTGEELSSLLQIFGYPEERAKRMPQSVRRNLTLTFLNPVNDEPIGTMEYRDRQYFVTFGA